MRTAFAADGRNAPKESAIRRVVGLSLEEAIGKLWPEARPADRSRLADGYRLAFRQPVPDGYRAGPLFPGIAEILEGLSQRGMPLGIATGKSQEGMRVVFEDHELSRFFQTVETADKHPSKPDPSMVFAAAEAVGAEPTRTWVIGDTTYDIEMASRAGARPIGVAWGNHSPQELREAGATDVLERAQELIDLIDRTG